MLRKTSWVIVIVLALTLALTSSMLAAKSPYLTDEEILSELRKADIDWKAADGETIVAAFLSDTNIWNIMDMEMIELFEELSGIRVIVDIFEETELRQKTHVDLLSKTGIFDVVLVDPMYIGTFAMANGIENLDTYMADEDSFDKEWFDWPNDFPEGFRKMGQHDGKQYGIPMHISGTLFYYNKENFKESGLDPDSPPKTMEELEECAAKLHAPAKDLAGIGLRGQRGGGLNVFIWSSFLKSFGGKWFDENWEPMLDSKEAIASIETYARLLQEYGPPGYTNWEWSKVMTAMTQGNIAMAIDAPTFAMAVEDPEKSVAVGEWGYAPQPAGPNGTTMVPYSWYLSINSHSIHKEASWLFVQYLMSKSVHVAIGGPLVCTGRVSVLEDPIWVEKYPWMAEWRSALIKNLDYADPNARPRIPEWSEVGDIMGIELQAAISGAKTPEEAAKDANDKIRKVMEDAGYYK